MSDTSRRSARAAGVSGLALTALISGFAESPASAQATSAAVDGPIAVVDYTPMVAGSTHGTWTDVTPADGTTTPVPVPGVASPLTIPTGSDAQTVDLVTFSPDGKKALYTDATGCQYLTNADGTDGVAISTVTAACRTQVPGLDRAHGLYPYFTWTPDNRLMSFDNTTGAVTVVRTDGTGATVVAHLPTSADSVTMAPNGDLAFANNGNVDVLDAGASTPRVLTGGSGPRFSPDGSRIAFLSAVFPAGSSTGFSGLFTVATGGSTLTQVTDTDLGAAVEIFTWSPDSKTLAYSVPLAGGGTAVYQQADGQLSTRLLVKRSQDSLLPESWHPGPLLPAPAADRVGGADRVDTSLKASQWLYGNHGASGPGRAASVAVLSRSDQFADALGGSALAAEKGGPLLLTPTAGLDPRVRDELKRILAPGATVYVLGGTSALSPAVADAVTALGFHVDRLSGGDRYATSVAVAQAISPQPHTVMVATGLNYPDALAAGAAAAQDPDGGVVVLSADGSMPASVKTYLGSVDPHSTGIYAVGGFGETAVKSAFPQWASSVTVLKGNDRFLTAQAVATSSLFSHMSVGAVGIATGFSWPDALSGGALIATLHGPLLLSDPASSYLPAPELDVVRALAPHLSNTLVFGGPAVVSDQVFLNTAQSAFGAGGFFTYVDRETPAVAPAR